MVRLVDDRGGEGFRMQGGKPALSEQGLHGRNHHPGRGICMGRCLVQRRINARGRLQFCGGLLKQLAAVRDHQDPACRKAPACYL